MSIADDDQTDGESLPVRTPRPLARAWLWRPWYAKLWWAGMIAYWLGKTASLWLFSLEMFYTSALAGFLNILFFPPAILLILGLGFARHRINSGEWVLVATPDSRRTRRRSVGGLRDPYSDPLDPRSGMLHWRHFHPRRR